MRPTAAARVFFLCCLSVAMGQDNRPEENPVSVNRALNRSSDPWDGQPPKFSDYVRCFCNLPRCVTTGYMCKSRGGGCYSDLGAPSGLPIVATYAGKHGCLEPETETSRQPRCQNQDGDPKAPVRGGHPRSLLFCCYHDMCNHVDNPQAKNLFNSTLLGDIMEDVSQQRQQQDQETFLCSRSEVWFRAATIAVPICGAVILFALIILAVKILKSENQAYMNHKLGPTMYVHKVSPKTTSEKCYNHIDGQYENLIRKSYYPSHQKPLFSDHSDGYPNHYQMPLLIQNRTSPVPKNEIRSKNSKSNLIPGCDINVERPIILGIEKEPADYSNVNIANDCNTFYNIDSVKVHKDNSPL